MQESAHQREEAASSWNTVAEFISDDIDKC